MGSIGFAAFGAGFVAGFAGVGTAVGVELVGVALGAFAGGAAGAFGFARCRVASTAISASIDGI